MEILLSHSRPYAAVETLGLYWAREGASVSPALICQALEQMAQTPPPEELEWQFFGHEVVKLLDKLYGSEEIEEERLAGVEWALLPVLESQDHSPHLLQREMARSPGFFAELVELVYKPEEGEAPELSEQEQVRAEQADDLLNSWQLIPGANEDGTVDTEALKEWVDEARKATEARSRGRYGEQCIGEMLAAAPKGADGIWPHEAVREVIEAAESRDIEQSLERQIRASRGFYAKDPIEGGQQEREFVQKYREVEQALSSRWQRTAAVLGEVADFYESYASGEDAEAEQREDQ